MLTGKVYRSEGDVITAFKPSFIPLLMTLDGKDRDKHSLIKEIRLFNEVYYTKTSHAFLLVLHSKKEPIVVAISIEIVLDQHKILFFSRFHIEVSPTEISTLEI
jgi:hypothetical protein